MVLGLGLVELVLGVGLGEAEEHRDRDRGRRDGAGQPRHPRRRAAGRRGRAWVLISGGSWRVRATAVSTWSRISAGASVVAAKAIAVATSRKPRTSLAQDWQRFRWRVNRVISLRRVQRVEGVGAGQQVQVLAEEPHQLTPRQSRIRISPSRILVLIAPSVTFSNSATWR